MTPTLLVVKKCRLIALRNNKRTEVAGTIYPCAQSRALLATQLRSYVLLLLDFGITERGVSWLQPSVPCAVSRDSRRKVSWPPCRTMCPFKYIKYSPLSNTHSSFFFSSVKTNSKVGDLFHCATSIIIE